MKAILLLLFFVLSGWVYAADGDSNLPFAEFVQVDDETMKVFQTASCQKERASTCSFPSPYVLFGSFTGANKTEAIVLSSVPMDCPCILVGELFEFVENQWQQIGPFENNIYDFDVGEKCYKISASSGNELLLCDHDFSGSYDKFFVDPEFFPFYKLQLIDLSKIPVVTTLFSTGDIGGNSLFCRDLQSDESFKLLDDIQMTFDDFNNDMKLDISLNLRETEINSSQCAIAGREGGMMKLGGKPASRHELHWLFDGETFTPTPETTQFLETLQTQ
jgi:hypothetical protein